MWKDYHEERMDTYGQHGKEYILQLSFTHYYGYEYPCASKVVTAVWDTLNECFYEKETKLEIYDDDISQWWEDEQVLCICDFVEDGTEYWSKGNYYEIVYVDDNGNYVMKHNYGQGIIYAEDFKDYFKDEKMKNRYYVCGIGYDYNDCVTDYEKDFGDFDTYEEAYRTFVKLQCENPSTFFEGVKYDLSYIKLQLEECEETDESIDCVDVLNETDIYKEDK